MYQDHLHYSYHYFRFILRAMLVISLINALNLLKKVSGANFKCSYMHACVSLYKCIGIMSPREKMK